MWLLIPYEKEAAKGKVNFISQNSDGIELEVIISEKGTWRLIIPYSNSKKADLEFSNNTQ